MKVWELKKLIEEAALGDGDEVYVLVGPDDEQESYRSGGASVGWGTPLSGQRKNRRYLLVEEEW